MKLAVPSVDVPVQGTQQHMPSSARFISNIKGIVHPEMNI